MQAWFNAATQATTQGVQTEQCDELVFSRAFLRQIEDPDSPDDIELATHRRPAVGGGAELERR
jgi:hypothetical protein